MVDTKKVELNKIITFEKYYKLFENNGCIYFNEIEDLGPKELMEKFNMKFNECYELYKLKSEICSSINNNSLSTYYSGDASGLEFEQTDYNYPLDVLKLSVRSYNCLRAASVDTVEDLLKYDETALLNIRNLGKKSYLEILNVIEGIKNNTITFNNKSIKTNKTIDDVVLSVRTYNALKMAGITELDSLVNYTLLDFMKMKNMGRKSAYEIYNIMQSIEASEFSSIENCFIKYVDLRDQVSEKFCNFKIRDFNDDLINDCSLLDLLKLSVESTIPDLYEAIYEKFNNNDLSDEYLINFYRLFDDYIKCSLLIDEDIEIDKRYVDILKERFNDNTLENVGAMFEITRERVRQIESKAIKTIEKFFASNKLERFFNHNIYTIDNTTILNDSLYKIIFMVISEIIEYNKLRINGSIYYVKKDYIASIEQALEDLYSDLLNRGIVFKYEINLDYNYDILSYYLGRKGIVSNNNCYYIKGYDADKILAYIKRYGIIDLSDSNYENISSELKELLDMDYFDKHNVTTAMTRRNIISMGESKYCMLDSMPKIEDDVFEKIYLEIEKREIVDTNYLLSFFKSEISELHTPTTLYFAIKNKYPSQFNYGGNNLGISIKTMPASKASAIFSYLSTAENPIPNVELMNKYGVDKTALSIIDQQNKDIFYIDDVNLWLFSKMNNLDFLLGIIREYIAKKQSFYVSDLYYYLMSEHKDIMENDFITTMERLLRVIKIKLIEELSKFEFDRFKKFYYKKQTQVVDNGFDLDF